MDIIDCSGLWTVTLGVGGLFACATTTLTSEVYESQWTAPDYSSKLNTDEYKAEWDPCP